MQCFYLRIYLHSTYSIFLSYKTGACLMQGIIKILKNSTGRAKITQNPTPQRTEKPSLLSNFCVSFLSVSKKLHVLLYLLL